MVEIYSVYRSKHGSLRLSLISIQNRRGVDSAYNTIHVSVVVVPESSYSYKVNPKENWGKEVACLIRSDRVFGDQEVLDEQDTLECSIFYSEHFACSVIVNPPFTTESLRAHSNVNQSDNLLMMFTTIGPPFGSLIENLCLTTLQWQPDPPPSKCHTSKYDRCFFVRHAKNDISSREKEREKKYLWLLVTKDSLKTKEASNYAWISGRLQNRLIILYTLAILRFWCVTRFGFGRLGVTHTHTHLVVAGLLTSAPENRKSASTSLRADRQLLLPLATVDLKSNYNL